MKSLLISLSVLLAFSLSAVGQPAEKPKQDDKTKTDAAAAAPAELAKAVFAAHGGDKLKAIKTLVLKGSVDVTVSTFPQVMPGTFASIVAGEKYRIEINSVQSIKQIYDGRDTYSSIQGFYLPPITRVGFPVLSKIGDTGYVVSAVPDNGKKKKGFRLTSPEGYATDFYVDEKTNLLKSYEASYDVGGRTVTTSAEIDKYKTVDGMVIPERYVQRFDLGQMTAYSDFKAKEILINGDVPDAYFAMPK
jgi:hypothetical protein